jgi:hypothetical protein
MERGCATNAQPQSGAPRRIRGKRGAATEWSSTPKIHKFVDRNESKADRRRPKKRFLGNPPFPPGDNTRAAPPS